MAQRVSDCTCRCARLFQTNTRRTKSVRVKGRPLRVCHLITSLEGGGSEHYLYQLLSRSPKDFSHAVFYLKRSGVIAERLKNLGIEVRPTTSLQFGLALRRQRPDILHTLLYRGHQVGRLMGTLAGVSQIASSQQAIDAWQKPWHRWCDKATLRLCDVVIVNSRAAQQLVRERLGSRTRPRIALIANGLDRLPVTLFDRPARLRAWGIPLDTVVGGTLMRLHHEKGGELLPVFAREALTRWPALHLCIGGVGPLSGRLHAETRHQPWSNRLHWLGWQEDVGGFLQSIDFFFSMSREESFPQALVEASAFGLPWIGPSVGGVPELLESGAVGILFAKENITSAMVSLSRLMEDRESFKQKATTAAPQVQQRHSLPQMVNETYDLFRSLVAG